MEDDIEEDEGEDYVAALTREGHGDEYQRAERALSELAKFQRAAPRGSSRDEQ